MEVDEHATTDDTFDLLSHNRRRLALQHFKQNDNPGDVDTLARRVARWEQSLATAPADVEVEQVGMALECTHLPKFEEIGLIESHPEEGIVTMESAAIAAAMANAIAVIEFFFDGAATDGD
ncbi:DUF7344 domain-containing protein [Halomarina oriensis]|uniref:DUF7344 domain-containing protein n=1 Tax=Halomarina oriensis TaxID=671145 RepID=A0A6B0GG66_9EURY|nr:hypothetical protein [Halomarina oriensis]MWG33812.1 hypothetical protein [Halomarina oriensis]